MVIVYRRERDALCKVGAADCKAQKGLFHDDYSLIGRQVGVVVFDNPKLFAVGALATFYDFQTPSFQQGGVSYSHYPPKEVKAQWLVLLTLPNKALNSLHFVLTSLSPLFGRRLDKHHRMVERTDKKEVLVYLAGCFVTIWIE
jgi:hypothetical protein